MSLAALRRRAPVLVLLAAAAACGPKTASPERQRAEVLAALRRLAENLAAATPACGTGSETTARPPAIVPITARQTLSCRDVGFLLRRLAAGRPPEGEPWVLVPARDTAALCPYLREEKVRLPVRALDGARFADESVTVLLAYAALTPEGGVGDVVTGASGRELVTRLSPGAGTVLSAR